MKQISLVSIIDDDIVFQYSTKKTLESCEIVKDVIQFFDGEAAIDYFIENKNDEDKIPDLVFLDLEMPYLDGWQFLDKFTENSFKKKLITIYVCSTSSNSLDIEKAATYSKLEGYLVKPVSPTEFMATLEREAKRLSSN